MIKKLLLICLIITNINTIFSQNLIDNGDFESGAKNGPCFTATTYQNSNYFISNGAFDGLENWDIAFPHPANNHMVSMPTPDWIDLSICNNDPGFTTNILPPTGSNSQGKFIGLINSEGWIEGVRTTLKGKLTTGNILRIKLKMGVEARPNGSAVGTINRDAKLKITFTKWAEHWNSNTTSTANVKWENATGDIFKIEANSPHEWYEMEANILIPDEVEGGNVSDLENIVIQAESYDNSEVYVFFDDIEIYVMDPCNSVCTKDNADDAINWKPAVEGEDWATISEPTSYVIFDDYDITIANTLNNGSWLCWDFQNATHIKLFLDDGYGGITKVAEALDINILDDGAGDYQFWYFGTDMDGNPLPNGVYPFFFEFFNCKNKVQRIYFNINIQDGGIPEPDDPNAPIYTDPIINYNNYVTAVNIEGCCELNKIYNNYTFDEDENKSVKEYLHAGTTANTTVNNDVKVRLYAEEELILGTFFNVKNGADFRAEIVPCGFGRKKYKTPNKKHITLKKQIENKKEMVFKIYPNPNDGKLLSLELNNIVLDNFTLKIFNISGQCVYEQILNASNEIHLNNILSSGLYTIQLISKDNIYTQKLCIIQ